MSQTARQELGAFLRKRRALLSPEAAGLISGGRRRTPGLRREEVAQLAGVGVTWYTWLEQGRQINASRQVLEAICKALSLEDDEMRHVFALAGLTAVAVPDSCTAVTEDHLRVLEGFLPYPASIQNGRFDLLAWNRTYQHLIFDVAANLPVRLNNLVSALTDPSWKAAYGDRYLELCQTMVARFRTSMSAHLTEPSWIEVRDYLLAESPLFREFWEKQEVIRVDSTYKDFTNAEVGQLQLQFNTFWIEPDSERRIILATPVGEETKLKLAELEALHRREAAVIRRPTGVLTVTKQFAQSRRVSSPETASPTAVAE